LSSLTHQYIAHGPWYAKLAEFSGSRNSCVKWGAHKTADLIGYQNRQRPHHLGQEYSDSDVTGYGTFNGCIFLADGCFDKLSVNRSAPNRSIRGGHQRPSKCRSLGQNALQGVLNLLPRHSYNKFGMDSLANYAGRHYVCAPSD
jgi:hypothetical protein